MGWLLGMCPYRLVCAAPRGPEWNWADWGCTVFSFLLPFSPFPSLSPSTSLCLSRRLCSSSRVSAVSSLAANQLLLPECSLLPLSTQHLPLTPRFCSMTPSTWAMAHHRAPTTHRSLSHQDFLVQNPKGPNPTGSIH